MLIRTTQVFQATDVPAVHQVACLARVLRLIALLTRPLLFLGNAHDTSLSCKHPDTNTVMSIGVRDLTAITERLPSISPSLWREVFTIPGHQPALERLRNEQNFTSISHVFCNLVIFMKQHGRGYGSFAVLRSLMLETWTATKQRTPSSAHAVPLQAPNPTQTPLQAHLANLLHSPHPEHHTRLHCLLYAELAAHHRNPSQLAWLTQQPCWARCNPWQCPPGRMLVAQAAIVTVIQAAVCLVHSGASQTATEALQVLELVHETLYKQPGRVAVMDGLGDVDGYLRASIEAVTEQHPHSGPGSRHFMDVCRLLCEDEWSREKHSRYPLRFRQAVQTLLLCVRHGEDVRLGADEMLVVVKHMSMPLSMWL